MNNFGFIVLSVAVLSVRAKSHLWRRGDDNSGESDHCEGATGDYFYGVAQAILHDTIQADINAADDDTKNDWKNGINKEFRCLKQYLEKAEDSEEARIELVEILRPLVSDFPAVDTEKGVTRFLAECERGYNAINFVGMTKDEANGKAISEVYNCMKQMGEDVEKLADNFLGNQGIDVQTLKNTIQDVREFVTLDSFLSAVYLSVFYYSTDSNSVRLVDDVYQILECFQQHGTELLPCFLLDLPNGGGAKKRLLSKKFDTQKHAPFWKKDKDIFRRIAELLRKEHHS